MLLFCTYLYFSVYCILQPVKKLRDGGLQLQWTHTYAKTHQQKCQVSDMSDNDKLKALVGTIDNLGMNLTVMVFSSKSMVVNTSIIKL